jgi:hypothetical protein
LIDRLASAINPIIGIADCYPRAASGKTTAPPSSVMTRDVSLTGTLCQRPPRSTQLRRHFTAKT